MLLVDILVYLIYADSRDGRPLLKLPYVYVIICYKGLHMLIYCIWSELLYQSFTSAESCGADADSDALIEGVAAAC